MSDPAAHGTATLAPSAAAASSRAAVCEALAACEAVVAGWEGGSAAFGRADAASDIDIVVLVRDGEQVVALDAIEAALQRRSPELDIWENTEGPFGLQRFWQARDARARRSLALVDSCAIQVDAERQLWIDCLEPARHGGALVIHDPSGLLTTHLAELPPFDAELHRERMRARLARDRDLLFLCAFVTKELDRERLVDAHAFHRKRIVVPLVTALNAIHRPLRFDFGLRYLHDELPRDVVERLLPIVEPRGAAELRSAAREGERWLRELLDAIDVDALPIEDHAASMRAHFAPR